MIEVGSPAPAFSLKDQSGVLHTLKEYEGQWLVLYFYPKDNTPGCTKESCGFRDLQNDFAAIGATILGVSCDDEEQHQKFIEKYNLPFNLLADTNRELVTAYGVWVEKNMYGTKKMGIKRTTFLIDPDGNIAKIYKTVKVEEHPQKVLDDLSSLLSE